MVHQSGPDGTPGLNDKYSVDDFYKAINDNFNEFKKEILEHPFFKDLNAKSIVDVYEQSKVLFMYCLHHFIDHKIGFIHEFSLTGSDNNRSAIMANTTDDSTESYINKKEFIKEVMNGVSRKLYLKEFFDDLTSYKQFRDDVDNCLLYMDFEKIHQTMELLDWHWYKWVDEWGDEQESSVPSVYGIREKLICDIKNMEEWINEHPESDYYYTSCGGFEIDMRVCEVDKETDPDDYQHRVRFRTRFILEEFDNGM